MEVTVKGLECNLCNKPGIKCEGRSEKLEITLWSITNLEKKAFGRN